MLSNGRHQDVERSLHNSCEQAAILLALIRVADGFDNGAKFVPLAIQVGEASNQFFRYRSVHAHYRDLWIIGVTPNG